MPQIDKVTFFSIVYWLFAFYFFLYLDINVNSLYAFLISKKLQIRRLLFIIRTTQVNMMTSTFYVSTTGL